MAKKTDLKFDDVDQFCKDNPAFAITKPVPNYAAIRAVLRAGSTLKGVELVDVPEKASDAPGASNEEVGKSPPEETEKDDQRAVGGMEVQGETQTLADKFKKARK